MNLLICVNFITFVHKLLDIPTYWGIYFFFLIFASKHRLSVLIRTPHVNSFLLVPTIYALSISVSIQSFDLQQLFKIVVHHICYFHNSHDSKAFGSCFEFVLNAQRRGGWDFMFSKTTICWVKT